jgi:GR25 family glycosyltransferase involved in LPS biosynthesis
MNFKPYMITFTKDKTRLDNFNKSKSNFKQLELFEAVNGIDDIKMLMKNDESGGFHTKKYRDDWEWMPGKLGCNLSYFKLFKHFELDHVFYANAPEWLFVIEDDTEITLKNPSSEISSILTQASSLGLNFVKFFITTGKEKIEEKIVDFSPELQFDESRCISGNFYKLMPSWGTVAQAFHIDSVLKVLEQQPWNDHIDQILMRSPVFENLNGAAYKQDFMLYHGAKKIEEANKGYGSLIFSNTTEKLDWRKLTRL